MSWPKASKRNHLSSATKHCFCSFPAADIPSSSTETKWGATKTFLVFPVHMWRKLNPDDTLVPYLAVVEEMCHCFYGIADETEVKHKVLDITNKYVDADAKFENLFPGWKDASVSYSA